MLARLTAYRGFILSAVKRDFSMRYTRSLLGVGWALLQPLAMICVYTLVFSKIMTDRLPLGGSLVSYGLYLCAGVSAWGLHAEIVTRSSNMFLEYSALLKKVSFPQLCIPLIVTLGATLNFLIVLALLIFVLVILGKAPGTALFIIAPVALVQICFSMGVGLILGVMNVFFRDVTHLAALGLQLWFWLTPIVYTTDLLPDATHKLFALNPMAILIGAWQNILVFQTEFNWTPLAVVALASFCLLGVGIWLLRRLGSDMMDEL